MSNSTNPNNEAKANKDIDDVTRDDCYWDSKQEDVLYDAYLILRDDGYSQDELEPLAELIQNTTIFSKDVVESFYNDHVKET